MCEQGLEGVVSKLADAPYRGTRSKGLGQDQMPPPAGVRDRRLDQVSDKKRGFKALLLGVHENGTLRLCGQGRHRLQRRR